MKRLAIALGVLLGLGWPAAKLAGVRKDLRAQRDAIDAAWERVEDALLHRAGLLSRLPEMVRVSAGGEQAAADSLTKARAALLAGGSRAERIAANARLDSALARLLAALEGYPKLQSNGDFLRLMDELYEAESRLAEERRKYNEAVMRYNMRIGLFPSNIAAALFGFAPSDAYFRTGPASALSAKRAF